MSQPTTASDATAVYSVMARRERMRARWLTTRWQLRFGAHYGDEGCASVRSAIASGPRRERTDDWPVMSRASSVASVTDSASTWNL